ncbi:alpha/beta fold hydrolase [Pseudomarimonas salicorniae]|uniref:Lysophospholipase n=1 Tax=Pseudomarimonas salicorniae TaxID=2933270 RepID=A0ABT0GC83_9GAMM|nr:alpha/beta fold hydrolase [Lysobacter sp. CAU 1642]MCK7592141.1 lysophospholipase [Lysobacter sp. CAU 1642]
MAACPDQLDPCPTPVRVDAADGVALRLDRWSERGQPVLLTHGFGQTRGAWSASARRLAELGYAPWTLDARGHGDSGRNPPGRGYAFEQFIEDAREVSARLPARPVLVGASMGGLIGIMAQARYASFSALVLVDITPRWDSRGVERILGFMGAHPDGFESLEAAADAVAGYLPHRPRKTPDAMRAVLRRRADGRWCWHWDPRLLEDIGRAGESAQHALSEAAREISVPTLLVSGGRSDLIGAQHVEEFMRLVPHAQHRRIDDATHMVAGDRNDAFTDAIVAFLDAAAPAAAATGA